LDPIRNKNKRLEKFCVMKSFIILPFIKYYYNNQIKEEGEVNRAYNVSVVDMMVLLKWIPNKQDTRLNWILLAQDKDY
jgi:hypothetical protein